MGSGKHKGFLAATLIVLVLITLISLTACNETDFWYINQNAVDNADILSAALTDNGDGEYTIDLTSDKEVFKKDVGKDYFCVLGQSDETVTDDEFINDKYISENSVQAVYKYIDASTAQVNVTDSGESYYYAVYIHKDATVTGNYAAAVVEKDYEDADTVNVSTNLLSVKSNVTEFNFEVGLTNAEFSDDITAENLSLGQGFEDMLISRITKTSDTLIKIYLEGTIDSSYSAGEIVFDENAIVSELIISLSISIENALLYADFTTAEFANNQLTFDVSLDGGTFTDSIEAELLGLDAGNDAALEDIEINSTNDGATLTISVSAADIDEAMSLINGAVLRLSKESTDFNEEISSVLNAEQAVLNANVDFIEQNETNYTATLILSASNGTLEEISAADILSIAGVFKNGTPGDEEEYDGTDTSSSGNEIGEISNVAITEVNKTDAGTEVIFTFDCEELDLEDAYFEGVITLANGKLKNLWATESSVKTSELYYSVSGSKSSTWDIITGLWDTYGDTISTYASGASTAFSVGKTVLEMTGVIESAEAKMDKIYDAVVSLQADVSAIKTQLASIEARIIELQDTTNKIKYDSAAAAWNSFYYGEDYKQLRNKITNYSAFIESSILSFLNGEKKVTLYYDVNGNVTVPMASNPAVSYRNIAIDTSKTQEYTFTTAGNPLLEVTKYKSKGWKKSYDGILTDLENAFVKAYPDNDLGENIFKCFQMQLNYAAVTEGVITGIANNYTNMCDYLLGGSQSKKPLDYFDEMLSYVYNFDSQAASAKQLIRSAISSAVMSGHALASLEISFVTPYADYTYINNYYNSCKTYLKNNDGTYNLSGGGQWSYIAGLELRLGYIAFTHHFKAHYEVSGTDGLASQGIVTGSIDQENVGATMIAYGSAVNAETVRRMIIRAQASGITLEDNLLTAGYNRDIVLNKSDYLITSSIRGSHNTDVGGDRLKCVDIVHDADNYYTEGKWYTFYDVKLDDRWTITADITDIYTGEQVESAEIIVTGYQWLYNFFQKNDEIYFSNSYSSNYQYIKFY